MRLLPVALAILLLAAPVLAKRAYRRPVNTPTGVTTEHPELCAWGTGFAVRTGERITGYPAAGKGPEVLVEADAPITAWATSPGSVHVAWIAAGKVHVMTAREKVHRELGAGEGGLAFAPGDGVLAWISEGKVILHDVAGERRRVVEPRAGRTPGGTPVFTGDGLRILVLSTPAGAAADARQGTIESADARADAPAFAVLREVAGASLTSLVAAPGTGLIAWLENDGDPAASTLRVFDTAAGTLHDFSARGAIQEIAFDTGGLDLLVLRAGKDAPPAVQLQQLRRSGTGQVYWAETLTEEGAGAVRRPVAGSGGIWFLRCSDDGCRVVRASLD